MASKIKHHGLRAVKLTDIPRAARVAAAQSVPTSQRDPDVLAAAFDPSDATYWVPAQAVEEFLAAA
jgi:hypothetical protein